MDIAAHNVTLDWAADTGARAKYKHFIFLNSSVRGPFVPNYLPPGWQWTQAFTARLTGTVKVLVPLTLRTLSHTTVHTGFGAATCGLRALLCLPAAAGA